MLKSLLLRLLNWWLGAGKAPDSPPIIFDEVDIPPPPVIITDYELPSPKIRIKPSDVSLRQEADDTMTLLVKGFKLHTIFVSVENTGSMEPHIDDGMQVLLEPLFIETDLMVGDIIAYQTPVALGGQLILHRVVDIGRDSQGWFCVTRGDTPLITSNDPWLVRPDWLRWLYRGVVL